MKNLFYLIVLSLVIYSCDTENDKLIENPSDISNISAAPRTGGVLINWDIPVDSNFTYVEIRYTKNQKKVIEKVSKYTDSLLVEGLINAEEFTFEVQTVNEIPNAKAFGNVFTTIAVRPIKREPEITYHNNQLEQIPLTGEMLDTYTQEVSGGPKENLIDSDPNTIWHSAWSSNVQPLPHWVQISFTEEKEIGAIKYRLRLNADVPGRPSQFGLDVSSDGENWERVWESRENLPVNDNSIEYTLSFDQNYSSQYFRIIILKNGGRDYVHLAELSVYKMESSIVDKEEEAEEEYYNF